MGEGENSRSLEQTPTWAVALVCSIFVLLSVLIEHAIHLTGKWLQKHKKRALNGALDKIKAELMLIGFISLLLPIGQKPITMICVSRKLAEHMLPCSSDPNYQHANSQSGHHRKLFQERLPSTSLKWPFRRILYPDDGGPNFCGKEKVSLVSQEGLHQLHIFIFVLAALHVFYSVLTMCLGTAKMREWKAWELKAEEYDSGHDPEKCIRLMHETSFGRRHMSHWAEKPALSCIECFFRQFLGSVDKVDYLTLRHGFIKRHGLYPKFDFHKYLQRSLDGDFKVVVGVSPPLWAFAVVFLLLNVKGWWTLFSLSFVPLIIIMLIGTKLELVITKMALEIGEKNSVVKGTPLVILDNKLFWFGRPKWVLSLIHFSLFQNAFEIAFFIWTWCIFGLNSCFHETAVIVTRVIMGTCAQVLCSYITLPLYALVSEMGSHMDPRGVFDDNIADAVEKWSAKAKKKPILQKYSPIQTPRKSKSEGDLQEMQRKYSFRADYEQREENGMGSVSRACSSSSKHSHASSASSSSSGMSNICRDEDAQAIPTKEEQVDIQMATSSQRNSPRRYQEEMDMDT